MSESGCHHVVCSAPTGTASRFTVTPAAVQSSSVGAAQFLLGGLQCHNQRGMSFHCDCGVSPICSCGNECSNNECSNRDCYISSSSLDPLSCAHSVPSPHFYLGPLCCVNVHMPPRLRDSAYLFNVAKYSLGSPSSSVDECSFGCRDVGWCVIPRSSKFILDGDAHNIVLLDEIDYGKLLCDGWRDRSDVAIGLDTRVSSIIDLDVV